MRSVALRFLLSLAPLLLGLPNALGAPFGMIDYPAALQYVHQPDSRYVRLLPPGLNGSSGAGMLHVDVPDGARVTIHVNNVSWETQSRNWSRYRHYRIRGLDPYNSIRVCVEVTLERNLTGCKQKRYLCKKSVPMKAGDNESLRFTRHDFLDENAQTVDECHPITSLP